MKLQTPTRFPVKAAKVARPTRQGTIYWLRVGDAVLVTLRPPRGLLGGMRALPSDDWATVRPAHAPPADTAWQLLPGSVLNRIVVPKKITVHLGKPSANVRNVTVSFQSYIANVASSEVYPTWDSAPGTRRTSI